MESPEDIVIWEWKDKTVWISYDLATSQILEKAYCSDQLKLILDHGIFANGPYFIDFSSMTQTNQRTNYQRLLRRFGDKATKSNAIWACLVKKKWEPYERAISEQMERAFCHGQKKLHIENNKYELDFVEMKQFNATTGFSREIRRQVDVKISLEGAMPPEINRNRLLPRITGVTEIPPEKLIPCYGTLSITLIDGINIPSTSLTGPDPFIVITTDFSPFTWKSQWKFKTTNPVWNESCSISISRPNLIGKIIFTVYHFGIIKKAYLGRLDIPLLEIVKYDEPVSSISKDLTYECKHKASTSPKGILRFLMKWTPKAHPQIKKIEYNSIIDSPNVTYHKNLAIKVATILKKDYQHKESQGLYHVPEFQDSHIVEGRYDKYSLDQKIGEGAYAVVNKAFCYKTNKPVAIKEMKTNVSEENYDKIRREIQILFIVDFENCVSMLDNVETKDSIFIIMEFISGGDLLDAIVSQGRFTEPQTKRVLMDVLLGLTYLHNTGIVHRDIKPENILHDLEKGIWKIADFGSAVLCTQNGCELTGFEGTLQYMAPEVFLSERYSMAIDIWSMGVLCYVTLSGYFPWQGQTDAEIQESITSHEPIIFYSPEFDTISNDAKEYMKRLLESDPTKRCNILTAKSDHWITHSV